MSETPDFFKNRQGQLIVADQKDSDLRGTLIPRTQNTVPGQMALPETSTNLPVPMLVELLKASGTEPGNMTHTRSGEVRESNSEQLLAGSKPLDSRGGQLHSVAAVSAPSVLERTERQIAAPVSHEGI